MMFVTVAMAEPRLPIASRHRNPNRSQKLRVVRVRATVVRAISIAALPRSSVARPSERRTSSATNRSINSNNSNSNTLMHQWIRMLLQAIEIALVRDASSWTTTV
jgi:hypothetical protein